MATMGEGRHVKGVIPSELCFKTVLAAVWDRNVRSQGVETDQLKGSYRSPEEM